MTKLIRECNKCKIYYWILEKENKPFKKFVCKSCKNKSMTNSKIESKDKK